MSPRLGGPRASHHPAVALRSPCSSLWAGRRSQNLIRRTRGGLPKVMPAPGPCGRCGSGTGPGELGRPICSHPGAESAGTSRMKRPCRALRGAGGSQHHSAAILRFANDRALASAPPGLAPWVGARAAKEVKMSPAAPCWPCSPPAPAAPRPERGHPLASSPHPHRQKPPAWQGASQTHGQCRARSPPAGGAAPGAGASSPGRPTPYFAFFVCQEGWAPFSCIILAIIPAARKIYGVRWPLCKIINKGRQYNLLKPPWKLNSSGGENAGSH